MKLSFYGGAGEVTGACYLLEIGNPSTDSTHATNSGQAGSSQASSGSTRILVDCGMIQGSRFVDKRNLEPFPFDPKTIDALIVTHAHIDHTGRIPKLARDGFRGKIYSTAATKDFASLLLKDSLGVLSKEAGRHKEEIFYSLDDVENALTLWEGLRYHDTVTFQPGVHFRLLDAGHILGSAMVEFTIGKEKILFTGDLGNTPAPLLWPVENVGDIKWLIIESAYGDRLHEDAKERKLKLERIIEGTVEKGGTLMIPAFAMERTQELLFELEDLVSHKRIPRIPVFIDSPLAIKATEVYREHCDYLNGEARASVSICEDLFEFPGLHFTLTTEESKHINDVPPPKIVIAGSGMSTGGRILHHERRYLPDPKSTLLVAGYQTKGTLGRLVLDGAKQVKIFDEMVEVNASIEVIGGYSAHADQKGLLSFINQTRETLKKVFIVQGEEEASQALRTAVRDQLGVDAIVPSFGQVVELS